MKNDDKMLDRVLDRKYRLIRQLGRGGMGSIYEAEHVLLHHKVAVKVLHQIFTSVPSAVKRFLREAQSASAIGHPNIIKVHDFGQEEDDTVFIVMELLKGEDLEELIKHSRRIHPKRAVSIILQVLSALNATHKKGIIHRDLKPDNIFIHIDQRKREEVKLLDFGVAKIQETDDTMGLTKTGAVLGTPYYLAPEQARGGKSIDARIDIWSTGVILYEALCGEIPFHGDNYNEVIGKILLEEPRPIASRCPNLPVGLAQVVEKAMSKNRNERFANANEMIQALMPFHDSSSVHMTGTAELALLDSVVPPTEEQADDNQLGTNNKKLAATANLHPENSKNDESTIPPPMGLFRPPWIYIAAGGVLLVTVFSVLLILSNGDDLTAAETAAENKQNGNQISDASTPQEPKATDEQGKGTVDTEVDSAASEVIITIENLPPRAKTMMEGNKITSPFSLPRSDEAMAIEVSAPGYEKLKMEITPDKDRQVKISMKKLTSRKRHGLKDDRGGANETTQKDEESWAKNPFD